MIEGQRSRSAAPLAIVAALAGYALAPSAAAAQEADLVTVPPVPRDYRPATTPWGEPDLRGTWPIDHLNFTTLQRTPEQGNRYWLTDEEWAARQQTLAARGEEIDNLLGRRAPARADQRRHEDRRPPAVLGKRRRMARHRHREAFHLGAAADPVAGERPRLGGFRRRAG